MRDPMSRGLVATCALAALLAACDREEVTHFRVAKAPPAAAPAPGMAGDVPPPAKPSGASLAWTLPGGWSAAEPGAMRYASFKVPVKGTVDASVVVLPGPAGGELANVNRWRNQIGLPPLDDAGLAAARRTVSTKAGPLRVYDFANAAAPPKRVIAGLTELSGNTWFVKLSGEAAAVGAARDDFMKLLGSLRLDDAR